MWKIFPQFRMRCRHCVRPMHSTKYEYVSWIRFEFRLQQRAQYRVWCALFSRLYLHVHCNVLSFALSTSKLIVSKILFIAKFGEMEGALIHKTGNHLSSDGASARAEQINKQTKKTSTDNEKFCALQIFCEIIVNWNITTPYSTKANRILCFKRSNICEN